MEFPGGQVQTGDHVPDTVVAVVGGPQPDRFPAWFPRLTGTWLQVQRPELVDAQHPAVGRRAVVRSRMRRILVVKAGSLLAFHVFEVCRQQPAPSGRLISLGPMAHGIGAPDPGALSLVRFE